MKTLQFQNNTYNVPEWACYITKDRLIIAWENEPKFINGSFYKTDKESRHQEVYSDSELMRIV